MNDKFTIVFLFFLLQYYNFTYNYVYNKDDNNFVRTCNHIVLNIASVLLLLLLCFCNCNTRCTSKCLILLSMYSTIVEIFMFGLTSTMVNITDNITNMANMANITTTIENMINIDANGNTNINTNIDINSNMMNIINMLNIPNATIVSIIPNISTIFIFVFAYLIVKYTGLYVFIVNISGLKRVIKNTIFERVYMFDPILYLFNKFIESIENINIDLNWIYRLLTWNNKENTNQARNTNNNAANNVDDIMDSRDVKDIKGAINIENIGNTRDVKDLQIINDNNIEIIKRMDQINVLLNNIQSSLSTVNTMVFNHSDMLSFINTALGDSDTFKEMILAKITEISLNVGKLNDVNNPNIYGNKIDTNDYIYNPSTCDKAGEIININSDMDIDYNMDMDINTNINNGANNDANTNPEIHKNTNVNVSALKITKDLDAKLNGNNHGNKHKTKDTNKNMDINKNKPNRKFSRMDYVWT